MYLKIFFFLKLISKEKLFPPKFYSRLVNADWLMTWQVKQTLDYVNKGAVDGLLNECIRRYFFPSRAKEAKTKDNNNNNIPWSQVIILLKA